MINPSAHGWIDKFFTQNAAAIIADGAEALYTDIRNTGLIYGHVVMPQGLDSKEIKGWTDDEKAKVALLGALFGIYRLTTELSDKDGFVKAATSFYKKVTPGGFDLLKKVLPSSPLSHELEGMIDERIHTNDNILTRSFSHVITNALLYMDVPAFGKYLSGDGEPAAYIRKLEETVVGTVMLALKAKPNHTEYDTLLEKLFEASVRYTRFSETGPADISIINPEYYNSYPEKAYLLDMAVMAVWTDGLAANADLEFVYRLAEWLGIDEETTAESIAAFDVFIKLHRKEIAYFKYSHPVKHFYDHTAQFVMTLINRNKKRLVKELANNGELMVLLTHSTHRSLNPKEKKKVRKQLLEICKTVPSLTIFLLPGGSLLLPLLIKFIPQLLPSAFNENLEDE
ncbi:MAG: LETM1-related biofilm-associated protein [Flavobacterium sp.]